MHEQQLEQIVSTIGYAKTLALLSLVHHRNQVRLETTPGYGARTKRIHRRHGRDLAEALRKISDRQRRYRETVGLDTETDVE